MIRNSCFAFGVLMAAVAQAADVSSPSLVESYLSEGRLAPAAKALTTQIRENPSNAEAQYGLGVVRLLQAVEGLAQNLHRYGLTSTPPQLPFVRSPVPFVRLPVPDNPNPEKLTCEKWRGVLQQFNDDLNHAAEALAKVDDPHVKLRLPVGMIRLDLDGDGTAGRDETFWKVFTRVARRAAKLSNDQKRFPIGLDAADVHWMIGYTHLLRAMTEAWLAYDTEDFFGQTAHFLFTGVESPYQSLGTGRFKRGFSFDMDQIADAVAAIHLVHFQPADPKRLSLAREHLLAMINQSRLCWEHALAEKDDDREWIPNANQTSLTPLTVNDERIAAWKRFLDEADAVLRGDKLLPHW